MKTLLKMFLVVVCMSAMIGMQAQAVSLCNEKFSSKTPQGWSIQPTSTSAVPTWTPDKSLCVSANYSMHGYVPFSSGDTAELVTPYFDCSQYKYVMVQFSHICKVLPSDICEVMYQEQGLGTYYQWKPIPADAYRGKSVTYARTLVFDHNSYNEWKGQDTFATPAADWWKEESFDVSDYASYTKIRFKFIIRKGSYYGSFIANGWYVDDFKVLASNSLIKNPVVEFLTNFNDTVYSTGPFNIRAKVASRSNTPIKKPQLIYTAVFQKQTTQKALQMTAVEGDTIWTATIPQQNYGTTLSYSIDAADSVGNTARAADGFVLKRKPGIKMTGYTYYQPNDTANVQYTSPYIIYTTYQTAPTYSRTLYLGSEINPSGKAMSIATMAWYNPGVSYTCTRNIKVWMMATTATTTTGSMDPTTAGAKLVYNGSTSCSTEWNEIEFDAPFTLPAGQNLMVFIESAGGPSANNYVYWAAHYQGNRNVYSTNMTTYTNSYYVPLMRFGQGIALDYDSNSVALLSIDQPGAGSPSGTQSVKVTLQNKGLINLTSAKVNWTVNGVLQTPYTWTGNLACDFNASAVIGSFTKRNSTYDTIVVWVSDPNNKKDPILIDDTLSVMPYGCDKSLSGVYTIGNGKQYDFQNLNEALFMLNVCGVSSDITFKLAAQRGNNLNISDINSVLGNYHLTITSLDNDADSVEFSGLTNAADLKNISHIIFEKLSFVVGKGGSHAVAFKGSCDDITFHNCYFSGVTNENYDSRSYATIFNDNGSLTNIRFIHNEIVSGTYSFYFVSGSVRFLTIDSNYMHHQMTGIDMEKIMDVQFNHNDLYTGDVLGYKRPFWQNVFYQAQNMTIDGNRFRTDADIKSGMDQQYAIHAEECDSLMILNNEIIMSKGINGPNFGIYSYSNNACHIVNNSVLIASDDNSYDRSYGIYMETRSSSGSIRNNIVAGFHEYTVGLYLYDNSLISNFDFDYNCWYSPDVFAYIYGNNQMNNVDNLNDFRLLVPQATHDLLMRPAFASNDTSLRLMNLNGLNCPMFRNLTWDKDGLLRTAGTTMGCYSCEPPQKNAGLVAILNWPGTTHASDSLLPYIVLQNGGKDTLTAATLGYELNGVAGTPITWSGVLATSECDTLPLSDCVLKSGYNTLRVYITNANGKKDSIVYDDTITAVTYTCGAYFSGNYNIGDTCEFQTIEAALNAITRCGLNGPVTLRMMPGTYSTDLTIGTLPGISDTNTLTITSYSGKNDVFLTRMGEGANIDGVVDIIDGQHIILSHLVFDANCTPEPASYAYAHGVYVSGNSHHIEIRDCEMRMPKPNGIAYTNASAYSGISLAGRTVHDVIIRNNTFDGGAAGVYVYGMSSSARLRCVEITDNIINNVDYSGIYMQYADSVQVRGNRISQRAGDFITPSMNAIYAYYTNANIINNHINALTLNSGIYMSYFGDSTFNNWNVFNNEIMGKITANNGNGMYIGNATNARIYHNSIYVGSNQRLASGVWFNSTLGSIAIDFRNNIVFMNGRDYNNYPIYRATALNNDLNIGYNAYYNAYPGTPIIAYVNDLITDWKDYLSVMPQDSTSKVVLPEFMNSNSNLRISDTVGLSCPIIAAANFDINDSARNGNSAAMGAYNFYRSNLDLAVKAIVNPGERGNTSAPEALKVVIANKGLTTVTSATLNYRLNGITGTAYNWTGNLATSATDTITLANIQVKYGSNNIDVFLSKVNGKNDDVAGNDTAHTSTYGCNGPMKGTYNIGGANADFANINDAVNTMNICGLGGHVTFLIAKGNYPAAMFEDFSLTDYDRIVTFASASGNANDVVFEGNSGLYVKNSNYITFEGVTLKGAITGVQLEQNVSYIKVRHCNIIVPDTVTTPEYRGVSYNNTSGSAYEMSFCEFFGNNIHGGYANIHINYAYPNHPKSYGTYQVIDSNTMSGAYRYGVYNPNINYLRCVNRNTITNGSHAEEFDGIYMYNDINCDSIFGNTIHINVPKKANGIFATNTQNNPSYMGSNRRVSNNEIIVRSKDVATGISFLSFGGYATLINNSIYVDGIAGSYAMALGSNYTMLYNNNQLIAGNANSTPLFTSGTGTYYQGDYNNYASPSGTLAVTNGTSQNSIASLQSLYAGNDVHSSALKANLKDTTLGSLRISNSWDFTAPISDNVNYDITGMPRTYISAMGCYDLEPDSTDAGLVAFAGEGLLTSTGKCNLGVIIKNFGQNGITSASVALYVNGTKFGDAPYSPSNALAYGQTDSVALGSYNFPGGTCDLMAIVSMKGDNNVKNDTLRIQKKICGQVVGGTYVIGPSSKADYDFANLNDLFNTADTCGVYADVVLEFETGTYTFTQDILLNTSFMHGYHLTWTSQGHNRDSVTFTSNLGSSTTNGMFTLNNANNVTFCDLNITSTNRTLFQVNGPNRNVEIRHCNLFNGRTATAGATMTITNGDNPSKYYKQQNWRVIGNHFEGGCRSFKFRGNATEPMLNWTIDSNIFEYGYDRMVQIENFDTLSFCYNKLYSRSSTTGNHFQLYLTAGEHATVVGNLFDASTSSTTFGANSCIVTFYGVNYNSEEMCLFANNVIKVNNTNGTAVNQHGKLNLVHNSIYIGGSGASGAKAIRLYQAASVLNVYGNMFYAMGDQTAVVIDANAIASNNKFDYNNYYSANGAIMDWGGTKLKSMSAVRLTNLQDTHSISTPLSFINPNIDLRLTSYAPVLMPNMGYIADDYYGNPRSNPTAMGAYEPSFQKLDAALTDFANTTLTGYQSAPVYVTLMNAGTDTLKTANIDWTFNGVQQTQVKWTGSIPVGGTSVVSLGNVVPLVGSVSRLVAWVSNPNNSGKDSKPDNDTTSMSEYVCKGTLSGSYTVGGSNPDFADMDEAMFSLTTCGISGPVILKYRSGTYGAITIEGNAKGASATNTVTVMPDSGATVVFDGGAKNPALTINGASHWVFKGLTLGNTTDGLIGVKMTGMLEDITVRDCEIYASKTATSSSNYAIGYPNTSGSGKYTVDVRILHNNIVGGYYNIYTYYMGSGTGTIGGTSMYIDSNSMSEAYYAGLYTYYYSNIASFSYNTITNRSNSSTFYGVYSMYYNMWDKIEGNRMNLTATSTTYGFYLYYYNQYYSYCSSRPAYLTNNEIIIRSASGSKYAIYVYYPYGNWDIHNNSVYVKANGTKYGMYLYNTGTAYKINATRNQVMCDSTGTNYPLYISSTTYGSTAYGKREFNNFYSSTNVAYVGGALTSISALQSATAQDSFSVMQKPAFVDVTKNLMLNDYTGYSCYMHPNVPLDIDGKFRSGVTSMGCYGAKMYDGINLEVAEFVSPKAITDVICYTDYTPVEIAVKNSGMMDAHFDSSALKVSMDVTGAVNYHFDTTITAGSLRSSWSDTLRLGNIPTMASGIYNIRITLSDTADHRDEDDTLSLVYNAYRVELPYDVNFSTQPKEFVNAIKSGTSGWTVVQGAGMNPSIAPAFGTGRLEFAGAGEPGAFANAIFNAVNIRGCINPKLSFWYAHAETDKRDMMIVLVTSNGGASYTEVGRVIAADTANYWKRYNFDLTPFSNTQCLSVVFQAVSFGGVNQSIDRILISAQTDVEMNMVPISLDDRIACDNTPVEVKAVLTNNSPTNIQLVNDTLTFNVTGADTKTGKFVYNGQINGYTSDTVTVGQFDMSANGNYYLELYMQSQDDNTANDTLRDSTILVHQDIALTAIRGADVPEAMITGDSVNVSAVVVNTGNIMITKYTVRMDINGEAVLTDTVFAQLGAGDSMVHKMSKPYIVPAVSKDQAYYMLTLAASIGCDADNDNDSLDLIQEVDIPDTTDVQVLDITAGTPAMGKTKQAPTVRLTNVGNTPAYNVNIHVKVMDSTGNAVDSISGIVNEIQPGTNTDYLFTMTYKVPNYTGNYTLKAYVEKQQADYNQRNDTLSKAFGCTLDDTRIGESEDYNWSMGQNIPNPAKNITRIPFELPVSGNVVFSVMSANGQLIYREEISAEAGSNSVSFDASDIAGGIYYYSMEYQGQRIVKKMNVVR